MNDWPTRFEAALVAAMVRRLGIVNRRADDRPLVSAMLAVLRRQEVTIDRFFFDWRGGRVPEAGDAALAGLLDGREPLPGALGHDLLAR